MDLPGRQGLYDPANEHDACGVGFVAHIKNQKSHSIVSQGLQILEHLTHRGATGYDPLLGDGAGILIQLPDAFLREEATKLAIKLPREGNYACGNVFLPQSANGRIACESVVARVIAEEGQHFLGWRDVPRDNSGLAQAARDIEPVIRQVFIGNALKDQEAFERKLFVIRKRIEHGGVVSRLPMAKCFTSLRFRPAPWFTRACYSQSRLAPTISTCLIHAWFPHLHWFTSGFLPTLSQLGIWRTPSA